MPEISRIHDKVSIVQVENFEQMNKIEGENALNIFYGIGSMNNNLEKKIEFFEEILEIGFIPIVRDSGGNQICLNRTRIDFAFHLYAHQCFNSIF
ncbi:hypothetical protein NSS79_24285 [Paenibacillus sp. FSL L8-0436]|uniref:hypothetical protein n=1 Tax=Paenibacillus sp. FSL L8-0436 TaxID=2954686 RepID=UPI003157F965